MQWWYGFNVVVIKIAVKKKKKKKNVSANTNAGPHLHMAGVLALERQGFSLAQDVLDNPPSGGGSDGPYDHPSIPGHRRQPVLRRRRARGHLSSMDSQEDASKMI